MSDLLLLPLLHAAEMMFLGYFSCEEHLDLLCVLLPLSLGLCWSRCLLFWLC